MEIQWDIHDDYIICKNHNNELINSKIASFDLDDTLIKTKSGKEFSQNENDWELFEKNVLEKLLKLSQDKYNLVIITNQSGIKKGKTDLDVWKKKVENIMRFIGLNLTI